MKVKMYTLAALCLFFFTRINAQTVDSTANTTNKIDLTLLVEDTASGQEFSLLADDVHNVIPHNNIIYNIKLAYQSEVHSISYFRLRCQFDYVSSIDPLNPVDDPLFLGATAPVIIPPVKKKKKVDRRPLGTYPYLVEIAYPIRPTTYKVTIELLKYKSFDDYIEGSDHYEVNTTKVIYLDAMNTANNGSIVTYPNPSTNYITIEEAYTTIHNLPSVNTPLTVVIYTDQGVQLEQHTLTPSDVKTNSFLYDLTTSHLPKGTYYLQLSHNGKTKVKTIIKE